MQIVLQGSREPCTCAIWMVCAGVKNRYCVRYSSSRCLEMFMPIMKTDSKTNTNVILMTCSSVNQLGSGRKFEKSFNQSQTPEEPDAYETRDIPTTEAQAKTPYQLQRKASTTRKWTKHNYKEVIYADVYTTLHLGIITTQKDTYTTWRNRISETRLHIDSNKLAAVK